MATLRQFLGEYAAEITFFLFKIAESMLEPTIRMFIYDGICLNLYPPSVYGHQRQHVTVPHQPFDQRSGPSAVLPNLTRHLVENSPSFSVALDALDEADTCGHLHHYPSRETAVQDEAARYMIYYKILLNAPAMFLVLFCGAMSDRVGRKLPILLTCFGTVMAVLLYMVSVYIGPGHGAPYLPLFLVGAGIRGLFGRSAVMTMAVHSYVSDHSSSERRTNKISNLVAMSHFGYLVGSSTAGVLLDHFGFVWVFLTVIGMQTACTLTATVCMEEFTTPFWMAPIVVVVDPSTDVSPHEHRSLPADGTDTTAAALVDGDGAYDANDDDDEKTPLLKKSGQSGKSVTALGQRSTAVGVQTPDDRVSLSSASSASSPLLGTKGKTEENEELSLSSKTSSKTSNGCLSMFKDSFMVLIQRREGHVRCQLVALFIAIYVQQMMKSGEIDVLLLYVERTPMNMSKTTYGYFLSVNYLCLGLSAFILPWIFERLLHLGDGAIAVIGLFTRLAGLSVLCMSNTTWMVFLAAAIAGPHSLTVSSCKSMISKMIGDGDMGKTFSLLSSGETLANLLGTVVFANLYSATLTIYAGSTFAVEGVVFVVLTFVIGYIGYKQRHLAAESGTKHDRADGCCCCGGGQQTTTRIYTSP